MPERFSFKNVVLDVALVFMLPVVLTVAFGMGNAARPAKTASGATPADFGLPYEQVSFYAEDGVRIAGWFVPKKGGEGKATVVVLHGYPAEKGDILARVAFLAERYNLLLIDFRYFGESGGSYTTVGAKETEDALAAIEFARSRKAQRIGVYGFSMGGAVALMVLPKAAGVDAVVAEAPYADLHQMVLGMYAHFGPFKRFLAALSGVFARLTLGIDIYAVSPEKAVAGTKVPVLLIHGRYDKVIPFENAERIARSLKDDPAAELWFHDSAVHGEASAEFPAKVGDFLSRHLSL